MSLYKELIIHETSDSGDGLLSKSNINANVINRVRKKPTLVEENNNEIDSLAVDFEDMGNITNRFKCKVENNDGNDSGDYHFDVNEIRQNDLTITTIENEENVNKKADNIFLKAHNSVEDEYSSDDFEDDLEETEAEIKRTPKIQSTSIKEQTVLKPNSPNKFQEPSVNLNITSKVDKIPQSWQQSQQVNHFNQTKRDALNGHIVDRSSSRGSSSSQSGSVSKQSHRINMSFTNDRSKEIERENHILLKKILKNRNPKKTVTPSSQVPSRSSSATIARKRAQERIQHDNLILLRKIQGAKPSKLSLRK